MDVANTLTTARSRAGLTQTELAARAGTSQATLSAYERGRKQPSVSTLSRLLDATGSRLSVESDHPRLLVPTRAQAQRTASTLLDVLALAAALPTRHEPELRFPRLGAPRP